MSREEIWGRDVKMKHFNGFHHQYRFCLLIFLTLNISCREHKQMSHHDDLKNKLTPLQYHVIKECGTERPFQNEYWDNKRDGLYLDRVSGEILFSSLDKFDSGTGWPSFYRPFNKQHLEEKKDSSLGMSRVEVRSVKGDAHLGHLFTDGPKDQGGLRYCINSASLLFVPVEEFDQKGLSDYKALFSKKEVAILAGGCFWGMEELLRKRPGVLRTEVGYMGGIEDKNVAIYEKVRTGNTGHAESVLVEFDPQVTTYRDILFYFFKIHDPTTINQQGNDKGTQYRSAIFYQNEQQRKIAEEVKSVVASSAIWKNRSVVTEIVAAKTFYPAEDYHQDYLVKNPKGYSCHYERSVEY